MACCYSFPSVFVVNMLEKIRMNINKLVLHVNWRKLPNFDNEKLAIMKTHVKRALITSAACIVIILLPEMMSVFDSTTLDDL